MLRCHKGTLLARSVDRSLHNTLSAPRIVGGLIRAKDILKPVRAPNHLLGAVIIHAEFIQGLRCNGIAHMQNPQQQLAGANISFSAPLRNIL